MSGRQCTAIWTTVPPRPEGEEKEEEEKEEEEEGVS
tara:strand:+ start:87 stop:194 length:108 start_codon:yes stop_codon:yes gene_type:complete